jgi:glycosyltransferase involved in cell wall biosynthesis
MFEITIPVLNEEKKLKDQVGTLYNFIIKELSTYKNWGIVIADNGSSDNTQVIGEKLGEEYANIKYLRLNEKGVGLALQTSWSQSQADIIGYMDLDLATNLNHLKEVLKAIESGYDLVYGSRLNKKSKVTGRSLSRELTSRCFNYLLRSYLGVRFSDGMCGFKFMKREVFKGLQEAGANSKGWFFSTELLVTGEWLNLKIFELPVEWTDSTESHVRIIPLTLQYLKSINRLKKNKFIHAPRNPTRLHLVAKP